MKVAAATHFSTPSLHDALPIWLKALWYPPFARHMRARACAWNDERKRSEEHTSELQSRFDVVCRLLLVKKFSYLFRTRRIQPELQMLGALPVVVRGKSWHRMASAIVASSTATDK